MSHPSHWHDCEVPYMEPCYEIAKPLRDALRFLGFALHANERTRGGGLAMEFNRFYGTELEQEYYFRLERVEHAATGVRYLLRFLDGEVPEVHHFLGSQTDAVPLIADRYPMDPNQ